MFWCVAKLNATHQLTRTLWLKCFIECAFGVGTAVFNPIEHIYVYYCADTVIAQVYD